MVRPKQYSEQVILEKMVHVFWQKGFNDTSIRDLEKATGLNPSSLYNAFGNKQQLFEQTLTFYIDNVIGQRISVHLLHVDSPIEGIRSFFTSAFFVQPDNLARRSCLLINSAAELGQKHSNIGKCIRSGFKRVELALVDSFKKAQKLQQIRNDVDCHKAASQLSILMPGFLISMKNNAQPEQLTELVDFTLAQYKP